MVYGWCAEAGCGKKHQQGVPHHGEVLAQLGGRGADIAGRGALLRQLPADQQSVKPCIAFDSTPAASLGTLGGAALSIVRTMTAAICAKPLAATGRTNALQQHAQAECARTSSNIDAPLGPIGYGRNPGSVQTRSV